MLYAIYCLDKPDSAELRQATRAAHLAYMERFRPQIHAAGPLLAEDGTTMLGSLLILDFPDRAAVEAFLAADPYNAAGLFARVEVSAWKKLLP